MNNAETKRAAARASVLEIIRANGGRVDRRWVERRNSIGVITTDARGRRVKGIHEAHLWSMVDEGLLVLRREPSGVLGADLVEKLNAIFEVA